MHGGCRTRRKLTTLRNLGGQISRQPSRCCKQSAAQSKWIQFSGGAGFASPYPAGRAA